MVLEPEPAPTFEPAPGDYGLPRELLELATERLVAAAAAARPAVLQTLLRDHPEHGERLQRLFADLAGIERLLDDGFGVSDREHPAAIGPYRVLRVLGEGAFGVVFLCEQIEPVPRQVAIKVLRPGAGDRSTLARFDAERRVLATLSHAAIAHIFDAGALPDGRPYFVMEHVVGLPISSHCDRDRLGVRERLALFVRLCQGVQHAHRHGIVHRDLKPANILVVEQEGPPQPKIIDFGIAKALRQTAEPALQTETGRVVGTPGYMSPEQSTGNPRDVDARADVFSLGVILYELLTGELPWGRRETTETEPARPSARVASDAACAARLRRSQPRQLAAELRGELDCIVLEALGHERELRYASAEALAADVERYLRGEPITAAAPSLWLRVRRRIRRHRRALPALLGIAAALALGLWLSLHFRAKALVRAGEVEVAQQRASAAQDRADGTMARAEEAVRSLLARANDERLKSMPESAPVRRTLARDALAFYDEFLRERPTDPRLREGRCRTLETLSQVQLHVGEYEAAAASAAEAASEAEALLAAEPDSCTYRGIFAHAHYDRAQAMAALGQRETALAEADRAVEDYERCYGKAPLKYAEVLAAVLVERSRLRGVDAAEGRLDDERRAIEISEALVRERPDTGAKLDLIAAYGAHSDGLMLHGELDEAATALQRAEVLMESTPEASPAFACRVHRAMGELASRRGDRAAAIEHWQQAIDVAEHWCELEPSRPDPWASLGLLCTMLACEQAAMSSFADAARTNRRAIAVLERRVAKFADDPVAKGELAYALSFSAYGLLARGRRSELSEAEDYARRSIAELACVPDSVDARSRARARWIMLLRLGLVLDARGDGDTSEHWEATATALETIGSPLDPRDLGPPDAFDFALANVRVASHRFEAGRDAGATASLARADAAIRAFPDLPEMAKNAAASGRLAAMLAARRGDFAGAAAEAERVFAAVTDWRGALAAAEGMDATWRAAAAASAPPAAVTAYRDRAVELGEAAAEALQERVAQEPDDPWVVVPLGQIRIRLAEMLTDRGDIAAAQGLLAAALPALAALRDEAFADCWDEALYRRGQALQAR